MENIHIVLSASSVLLAALGLLFAGWIVKTSGRDRPHDPERLNRFIHEALRETGLTTDETILHPLNELTDRQISDPKESKTRN